MEDEKKGLKLKKKDRYSGSKDDDFQDEYSEET